MRKLLFIVLSIISLTAFAQDAEVSPLPKWFMKPAAHTYVGICDPNGDVQEAINVALLHYLICHEFSGRIDQHTSEMFAGEKSSTNMQSMLELDTTVQYSLEEIVSTPDGEYICRISDRPTLSRRIKLTYFMTYHMEQNEEKMMSEINETFQGYYFDETGESIMSYTRTRNDDEKGVVKYAYSSKYLHERGIIKEYTNDKEQTSLGEQLIRMYMSRLESGFFKENNSGDGAKTRSKDHHKPMPISGFEYIDGQIIIKM
jgi:hypothetical protein